jgi:hypothetical protein
MAEARLREWRDIDARVLAQEIVPGAEPAILRGLVRDWPAVAHARQSNEAICAYITRFDHGTPVDALLMPPEARGRIFYNEDMSGFNYIRGKRSLSQVIEQVARYSRFPVAPAVVAQSALVADCLPGFESENPLPLLDAAIRPRIWLGNRSTTPAHFDQSHNIACVVAGRRRFTVFAPGQVGNLYIGPLDFAPTPTPISLVDFARPDFLRFPRFREALAGARVAELEPGDAIYLPPLWWHHVESLSELNVLVNYWWGAAAEAPDVAFAKLMTALKK